ncbi:T9SS type A sorting domain-containing protein [Chitinophaga pendula]|uniref:T9SS type A sorting domain-containing protein n=1 Tax=Chitinophaga TaxID=79328 RepID=UPI000BAEE90C|nr:MULTISPECIES: T9SS type A sorting domain-containing protein [Chitinophaga]ASZ14634.1 hypothetical protein CK934_28605 [Chitinophaga sp. MD30]UCJ07715.1 T9SS type A sorting domain-containing protein [Chitinophaga pendula]
MLKTSTLFILLFGFACMLPLAGRAQSGKPFSSESSEGVVKLVKLYPNPATTKINFELQQHNNDKVYDLIVYNFLGKKVDQVKRINTLTIMNLDNYYSGVYIFQVRDQRGNLIESGKFNVVK